MTINLEGCLYLEVEGQPIKIECTGKCVKIIFSSFKALKNFVRCFQKSEAKFFLPLFDKDLLDLNLKYFLESSLIAESRSDIKSSWLGAYLGLKRSKIYFIEILRYIFS